MPKRKLPDIEVLRRMRYEEGMLLKDIAAEYNVTPNAVRKALATSEIENREDLVSYRKVVPWQVDQRYFDTSIMQMIRILARQYSGVQLTEDETQRIKDWFNLMAENHVVLDYNPEAGPNHASPKLGGFFYRTRVPEDQTNFWRDPKVNMMLHRRKLAAVEEQAGRMAADAKESNGSHK